MITIVSLGVEKNDWTKRAEEAIRKADKVLLRTALTSSAETLREAGIAFESLDALYESCRNFDTLRKKIAAEVVKRSKGIDLVYCVEGGVCEDGASELLRTRKDVVVIEGVTKGGYAAALGGISGAFTSVSAYEVGERKLSLPLVVYDLDSRELAGDVKLVLAERFGDEAPACLIAGDQVKSIPLYECDRSEAYDYKTMLVLKEQPFFEQKRYDLDDLMKVLRMLRAPDGCPWDRVQTHESIRINCIEEAYELVDAIDLGDGDKMREEAGDVIMQSAFHTLIEEEKGNFTMTDVLTEVVGKLIGRHTHIFGNDKTSTVEGVLSVWDRNKMKEKGQTTVAETVNDVPECFPALLRAQKVCKRMAKGGWDLNGVDECCGKLDEEVAGLKEAFRSGERSEIDARLGDVLMTVVQLGRTVGGDCEQALLDTVHKVQKRYACFEALVLSDGKDVCTLSDEERRTYYRRAKEDAEKS